VNKTGVPQPSECILWWCSILHSHTTTAAGEGSRKPEQDRDWSGNRLLPKMLIFTGKKQKTWAIFHRRLN